MDAERMPSSDEDLLKRETVNSPEMDGAGDAGSCAGRHLRKQEIKRPLVGSIEEVVRNLSSLPIALQLSLP